LQDVPQLLWKFGSKEKEKETHKTPEAIGHHTQSPK
jgi:hypothetical protein